MCRQVRADIEAVGYQYIASLQVSYNTCKESHLDRDGTRAYRYLQVQGFTCFALLICA